MALAGLGTGKFRSTLRLLPQFKDGSRATCCLLPLIWEARGFGSGRTLAVGIMTQRTIRPRIRVASIFQHWLPALTLPSAKGATRRRRFDDRQLWQNSLRSVGASWLWQMVASIKIETQCLLLAQSGHRRFAPHMSAYDPKRTSGQRQHR